MRQRSLVFLAFGSLASAACGGVPFGEAPAGDGGGEDAAPETSTVTIGPPEGGADATDATTDAPAEASLEDADRPDAAPDAGARPDASLADAAPDAGDACGSAEKLCGTSCVPITSPATGCGATSCAPCSLPNGTNVCSAGGQCAIGSCNGGFQLCTIGGITTCVAPDAVHGVFVSPSSLTSGCGSIGAPCGTIASGIAAAQAGGKTIVYLDRGTYAEEVSLAQGVTLEGGWTYAGNSVWMKAQCGTSTDPSALAVIQPTAGSVTVLASNVTATLDTLTVKSIPAAGAGQSLYGVFATGSTKLTLNAVEISVASGGAGSPGSNGAAPSNACTGTGPADGAVGVAPAPIASPTTGGTYSIGGYAPATGAEGSPGNPGDQGVMGGPGSSWASSLCNPNTGNCDPGPTVYANPGTGGCGGPGGAPGLGGGGGGASIALFVWGATAQLTGGVLAAGAGGAGGAGGSGGGAAASWSGMNGAVGAAVSVSMCKNIGSCQETSVSKTGGAAGGPGGTGSKGGAGASGSGGDAYGYYVGGGGTVTLSGVVPTCSPPGVSPGPIAGVSGSNGAGSCHD